MAKLIHAESYWLNSHQTKPTQEYRLLNNDLAEQLEDIPELTPIVDSRPAYSMISQKPLFIEGRVELQESQNAISTEQPLAFSLTGVVLGSSRPYALIADEKKVQHRLSEGDNFAGWLIKQVKTDKLVLQNKQITRELLLIPIEAKPQPRQESLNEEIDQQQVEFFPEEIPNIIEQ